jgi:tetratricopeptide (TPR) repeat protein
MKKLFFLLCIGFSTLCFSQNDYYLAQRYYIEGEYKKAAQLFETLYEKSPFNTTYLSRLIACYQETDNFSKAEDLLKRKLQRSVNQGHLHVFLGYNYQRQNRDELAEKQYKLALKTVENNPAFAGIIGRSFKEYSLLDYAIASYEKAMSIDENLNYNFQIAQINGEKGDLQKMFTSYIDLIDKNEDYLNVVQRYTSTFITEDNENEANKIFRKTLLKKSVSNPKDVWNELLSWLFTKQKDYNKAFIQQKALFQRKSNLELNNNQSSVDNIYQLGVIAYNNQSFEVAKECFNFVIEHLNRFNQEKLIDANLYIVNIHIATEIDNVEDSFNELFKKFGKNTGSLKIQTAYADFLTFQQSNPDKAKQVLEEALQFANTKYDKARIKIKLADVLVFTQNYNRALIYYSQVQTQLKGSELAQEARLKVARTSYFKADFDWAKAQLKILKSATSQLIANDAVDLYLLITDNEPVDSVPSGLKEYAKAELLAFQNRTQQAIDTLHAVYTKYKGQPIEDEALFKQAKLFVKEKQFTKAIENYQKIVQLDTTGILVDDALYEIAELYYTKVNDSVKASEYYQKILFDYPSSIHLVEARKKYRKIRGDTI